MLRALEIEADGHRALLAGDRLTGARLMLQASRLYRDSWELAPPHSYGRLIGMLKAAIIAGEGREAASFVRAAIGEHADSAPAHYALASAALALQEDSAALEEAAGMSGGSPAFRRAAEAICALAERDRAGYVAALEAILADFASREEHLTGVRIADTALMLEMLAEERGIAARLSSPLLPAA